MALETESSPLDSMFGFDRGNPSPAMAAACAFVHPPPLTWPLGHTATQNEREEPGEQ